MVRFLSLSLWAMVLTLLGVGPSENVMAQNLEPASSLDSWDVTPTPPPKRSSHETERPLSSWDTPSTNKNSHGLRYGTMIYRTESLQADLSLGLTQSWYLSPGWDLLLAGDYAYPTGVHMEAQMVKVFSRSLLKPSAHLGLALQPEAKNGLAFLLNPDNAHITAGLAMQDEFKKGRALKVELSAMAGLGGEPKFRFLIYALKVY